MKLGKKCAFLASIGLSACQNPPAMLHPAHIESPEYVRTAYLAHIQGQVLVHATVDSQGEVADARADGPPLLAEGALENIRLWKFEKPKRSPTEVAILYDYELEGNGGCDIASAKVTFDLPERVKIVARPIHTCDPSVSIDKSKKQ